ncbi:MAG: hypothetical protein LBC68_03835 [Prevotellaceae bacterium]|jgi:hypothetical protein|nr:hypothetical protein [Prevotellaceae bacterium]
MTSFKENEIEKKDFEGSKIEEIVKEFLSEGSDQNHRYRSFDYCYNYFHTTEDLTKDMEKSCLELAFYLASWGMLRNSVLLQKSLTHFRKIIEYINRHDDALWQIDVNNYTEENIDTILEVYHKIDDCIYPSSEKHQKHVLITKIMLGVFGFVPAYDRFFHETFKRIDPVKCKFSSFNEKSLNVIKCFYEKHQETIDKLSDETYTSVFYPEKETPLKYPRAKIIDMFGFTYGKIIVDKLKKEKENNANDI